MVIHALTNDLTGGSLTLAVAQARVLAAARAFASPGSRLWFCTVLPRTGSTDNWASYTGQSLNIFESTRVQINNWLRDRTATGMRATLIAAGVYANRIGGVVDATPAIERNANGSSLLLDANGQQTAVTGGYWITNGTAGYPTADGTHPSAATAALMASLVPVASMTIG